MRKTGCIQHGIGLTLEHLW